MSNIKGTAEVMHGIDCFKRFMQENEYTHQTTSKYCTHLSRFLCFQPYDSTKHLQEHITIFLENQSETTALSYFKECRAALRLYFKMITGENYPKRVPKERNPEIEVILGRFYEYSTNIKRIMPSSALQECSVIRNFLENTNGEMLGQFENITAFEVREFVVDCLTHLKDSSKGHAVMAVRNFFRFLRFDGVSIHDSIFLLPLSPAVWKNATLPTTIDEDVFETLYEIPDKNTPTGKRNRCIILCFTELALRCIEVSTLTIDDFNWRESYVSIKNTKNSSDRNLPISEKLGNAIVDYIQTARPITTDRTLFVRFKRTCGEPMGCSQIRGVVRRVYAKSGADIESTGTHILRRTAATKLYNAGNTLKMTADILGHESLDSTVRYAKADLAGLSQVAAEWPIGNSEGRCSKC